MLDDTQIEVTEAPPASPRSDLVDGAGWLALGAAVLIGSITMDRLADQDVPPYGAPGLLPGLLGIALLLLGGLLALRSLRRGGLSPFVELAAPRAWGRAGLVIALCVVFGTILVGHGVPFWAASTIFVTVMILVLQAPVAGRRLTATTVAKAVAIGLCAGVAITVLFQQIFLVRLP